MDRRTILVVLSLAEELPPMSQFLNRLLALPIHRQNGLFEELELRIASQIEAAIEAGCYEVGVETLKGESFRVIERQIAYTHANGTQTVAVKLERKLKNAILGVEDALNLAQTKQGKFLFNEQSGGVAIAIPTNSQVDENGGIVKRLNLIRPTENQKVDGEKLARSHWEILEVVLYRQETMPLVYGWKLRLSTVMGNQRLEVVGN